MPKLFIRVAPNGEVEVEGLEFQGKHCDKAIEKIIRELTKTGYVKCEEKKLEYYMEHQQDEGLEYNT